MAAGGHDVWNNILFAGHDHLWVYIEVGSLISVVILLPSHTHTLNESLWLSQGVLFHSVVVLISVPL